MRPRVIVVSYNAGNPLTPRGARTQEVSAALSRSADVRIIGAPPPGRTRPWWHRLRDRALSEAGTRWLVDRVEPWSWRTLARRRFDADLALLVGFPFSPLAIAGRALRRQGVPYVVDMSDPWSRLQGADRAPSLRRRRAAAMERCLWQGAAAGILTTTGQARDVLDLAPGLDVLVRPNGYAEVGGIPDPASRAEGDELHLGHFGSLYAHRADVTAFMRRLAQSGLWRRIVLHQYGLDDQRDLGRLAPWVAVKRHEPVPWRQVVQRDAAGLDAALLVGNVDPRQLPSKAVEYLTLPLPRLAVTSAPDADAVSGYVLGKPGWLVVGVEDDDAARAVREHVGRRWTAGELAPPPGEAWGPVAQEIARFVLGHAGPAATTNRAATR